MLEYWDTLTETERSDFLKQWSGTDLECKVARAEESLTASQRSTYIRLATDYVCSVVYKDHAHDSPDTVPVFYFMLCTLDYNVRIALIYAILTGR